ncbi:hypothetical protein TNCV_302701 [Trichonephila clavipes]|nr:hypothetical protein TNCV_302701 [Trichonephila clavipes]
MMRYVAKSSRVAENSATNLGESMGVCKCLVHLQYGSTLNSFQAASTFVRLGEKEDKWEVPDHPQGSLKIGKKPSQKSYCHLYDVQRYG